MGFYVNPSADAFRTILNYRNYVDKSELIAYMNSVLDTPDMLVISTRPRRFGKSFAAKMLAAYYSKGTDSQSLFERLKIAKLGYKEHLNKYDVLFIDIASFISLADDIRDTLADIQSEVISELKEEYPGCVRDNTKSLLKALMQVNAKTGNKFFVIIDEWDALFREAKDDDKLQESYIKFLRGMFKSPQTSRIFVGAYMTGILPIKKYGTQSALTDFREFTMLKPGPLAPFIGFTEDEVKELCDTNHLDFEETQRWYDGYQFEKIGEGTVQIMDTIEMLKSVQHVYCPNSIMELVASKQFGSYWTETETYESLKDYIDLNYDGLKDALVDMLGGKGCKINIRTFQNDMTSIKGRDDIFTLLVHLGYLAYDPGKGEVFIPNEEVRGEFVTAVSEGRRPELARAVKMSDDLLAATLAGDEAKVAELIETAHFAQTATRNYNEEHALRYVIIMAYLTSMDHYLQFEELASGRGYCDILFLPRSGSSKPPLLIELKWDKSTEQAITQIRDKQYVEIMKKFDYKGKILLGGVNYSTKTGIHSCKIEEYNG